MESTHRRSQPIRFVPARTGFFAWIDGGAYEAAAPLKMFNAEKGALFTWISPARRRRPHTMDSSGIAPLRCDIGGRWVLRLGMPEMPPVPVLKIAAGALDVSG